MLPQAKRVTRTLFPEIMQKGAFCSSSLFSLRYIVFSETRNRKSQCSIVVSKKVAKRAVDRNRIRRRVSATIEKLIDKTKPFAGILFVKGRLESVSPQKLNEDLLQLLKKAYIV